MQREKIIEELIEFFKSKEKEMMSCRHNSSSSITFNFFDFKPMGFEFLDLLLSEPGDMIENIKEAISIVFEMKLQIRIINLPKDRNVMIKDIRSSHLDQLWEVDAVIRQSSFVKPRITKVVYECPSCGNTIPLTQSGKALREPARCGCGRKGKFKKISQELIDTQRMVVEELAERLTGKEQPQQTHLLLQGDITDPELSSFCTPGTQIKFVGIFRSMPITLRTGGLSCDMDTFFEVISIRAEDQKEIIKITEQDKQLIEELVSSPDYYDKLVSSIAPEIYGMVLLKKAIVYHIAGGNKIKRGHKHRVGDINILVVADPAVAKSTSMDSLIEIAPKVIYADCTGISGAGLTAAAIKDEFIGGYGIQAGAAVLASGGSLILDELDKIDPENRKGLHVIMSEQKVVKHVANIHVTMKAECGVIGLCNPKFGRFDEHTEFTKQIDMPPSLISRFDIPILLRDVPNEDKDTNIANAILDFRENDIKPQIDVNIIKKIFLLAKEHKPKLSKESKIKLNKYYVNLRNKYNQDNRLVITPRQFETLIKLTEASAKIKLKDESDEEDCNRAIGFFDECLALAGVYREGIGVIDEEGVGWTKKDKVHTVLSTLRELVKTYGNAVPMEEIIKESKLNAEDVEEILNSLKWKTRDVFEPRSGFFGLL